MEPIKTVSPQLKSVVLNAMLQLVTQKAVDKGVAGQTEARRLMTNLYDITNLIRSQGHEVPRSHIEACLEVLTQKDGPVRFHDNEYNGRNYRYFGLTKKFWAYLDAQTSQPVEATA